MASLLRQKDIHGGDEGFRIVTLQDPEGNELQLYEWLKGQPK